MKALIPICASPAGNGLDGMEVAEMLTECGARKRLSVNDLVQLAQLPGAESIALVEQSCELATGHDGWHHSLVAPGQCKEHDRPIGPDDWWCIWTEHWVILDVYRPCPVMRPGTEVLDPMSMELDEADCRLYLDHSGAHGFEIRTPVQHRATLLERPTEMSPALIEVIAKHRADPGQVAAAFSVLANRDVAVLDLAVLSPVEDMLLQAMLENWNRRRDDGHD
ncbi:hypothetical protein BKG75_17755 [Mycobacteroides chelonae]|nr:hypothetical protein BKG75_17755 [Mycobacteroides chelonae]